MENLFKLTHQVIDLCKDTGHFIKSEQQGIEEKDIEVKDLNSFVSYVDKTAEKSIVKGLKQFFPEAGILAEEGTDNRLGSTYNWIIDPLDGTTNYLHGLPVYAISIGLKKNDEVILGVIYELSNNEMFYAWKNGGAFLNGNPIHVKSTSKLADTLLATGFPYYDYDRLPQYLNLLSDCFQKTRGVRRLGSAATDLAYVACGRFDGFFEYSLNAWDVAAGSVIVREAGGVISDFNGGDNYLFGREILATSSSIYPELLNLIMKNMNPK